MTAAEYLRRAQAVIADPAHWCQGVGAREADGRRCLVRSSRARSWCASGAMAFVGADEESVALLDAAAEELWGSGIQIVNDQGSHFIVMQVFDAAIQASQ